MTSISIVIPALNEAAVLAETLKRAQAVPEVAEIMVADGGSRDGTVRIAEQAGCEIIKSPPGRGRQMRLAAQAARGDVVLLLHADTWLPPNAGQAALKSLARPGVVGGGFWKVFRDAPWLLAGARLKCALLIHVFGDIFGDQGLFVRRDVLESLGGVPDMPLMEDVELCRRLRRKGRLVLAEATVTTTARRFQVQGVLRTYWRMARVYALYHLGAPSERLQRIYEKKK